MIIEIPDDNSIIKWKAFGEEDWKYAEISDLIKAYEESEVYMNSKDYDLYLEGYKQGKKDFERPRGEWVHRDAQWDTCSNCGLGFRDLCLDGFKFCPYCGAEMREGIIK